MCDAYIKLRIDVCEAPSRLLDNRPRSMDDDALIRRYRTSTLPFANLPGRDVRWCTFYLLTLALTVI
jgi:hypothetical protein